MTTSNRFQTQEITPFEQVEPRNRTTRLLPDPDDPGRLLAAADRRWIRLATRIFAASLDRRLAHGRPPETVLLAARAQILASTATRLELAGNLAHVLAEACREPIMRDPRAPLNRAGIVASGPALHRIIDVLRSPRPVSARGIAMISLLLSDGTGPLHRRAADLASILNDAVAELTLAS